MIFTHRQDPQRSAHITIESEAPAVIVVRHTDAKGKARKKTFKNAHLSRAHDAALRFLLNKEGYVLRSPQPGPLRWMTKIVQNYRGTIGHAVDPRSGVVWVADAIDHAHRITPGTLETTEVALASGETSPGCFAAAGADDSGWVLAVSWEKQRDGSLVRIARLVQLCPEGEGEGLTVHERARVVSAAAMVSLSADAEGRVLGPHAAGAGLYGPTGELLRHWPLRPLGERINPQGAISPSGAWAVLISGSTCTRIDLHEDEQRELPVEFEQLHDVQITDAGTVYLSAFVYPSHATYAVTPAGLERVSPQLYGVVSRDDRWLLETAHNTVVLRDLHARDEHGFALESRKHRLPVLGMAKRGRACFGAEGELVVLTDAYTIAAIELDALDRV